MSLRKRIFAWVMENGDRVNDRIYGHAKRQLFRDLNGTVVEVGPGAGVNFRYLPRGTEWIGIEPNGSFHAGLLRKADTFGIRARLLPGSADKIPLPDASADAVLCTLVLCSVPSAAAALKEMKRILKPGGRLFFVEHVAGEAGTLLRGAQNLMNPFNRFFADGCNCNRETWTDIANVGFRHVELEKKRLGGTLFLHAPHIVGYAVR